jgi:hypothetical protein
MVDVRGKREARENWKWKCVLSVEEREVTKRVKKCENGGGGGN